MSDLAKPGAMSLEHVLGTFAQHCMALATVPHDTRKRQAGRAKLRASGGMGLVASAQDAGPKVHIKWEITDFSEDPDWDTFEFTVDPDDVNSRPYGVGNSHGAVMEYTRLCAPVLAWAAANGPLWTASDAKHWPTAANAPPRLGEDVSWRRSSSR